MSLFSLIGLYEELLLTGSFRGAGFSYIDGSDEAGRRVAAFLFPGQDVRAFQDLGQDDGDIVINGIMVGDDCAAQADTLRTAFQYPGPGLLIHPWLGYLLAVIKPGTRPRFTFRAETMRVCTFSAVLMRYTPRPSPGLDTLQGLLSAVSMIKTAATELLALLLSPLALVLGVVSQVEALGGQMQTLFGSLTAVASDPTVGPAAAPAIALLGTIQTTPPDANYAGTVTALLAGPGAAVAQTSAPLIPAAVAPGGSTVTPTPVDGRVTAQLLLTVVTQLGAATLTGAPIQIPPGPSLILAAQCLILADATTTAEGIAFTSQQEAMSWRDTITAAIDAATAAAAALTSSQPAAAAGLWRALMAARAAWIADMNTIIGTLPAVQTLIPPAAVPVWRLAQYLAGDTPGAVANTYYDIIARNGIWNPAAPGPGPFEVLE